LHVFSESDERTAALPAAILAATCANVVAGHAVLGRRAPIGYCVGRRQRRRGCSSGRPSDHIVRYIDVWTGATVRFVLQRRVDKCAFHTPAVVGIVQRASPAFAPSLRRQSDIVAIVVNRFFQLPRFGYRIALLLTILLLLTLVSS
jgi:hypothetical protein